MTDRYQPGQILAVRVKGVQHEGVYAGGGRVVHKSKRTGRVVEESLDRFAARRPVMVVGAVPDPERALERARARLGERWTAQANCQRFVAEVGGIRRRSRDADFYAVATTSILAGIAWALRK